MIGRPAFSLPALVLLSLIARVVHAADAPDLFNSPLRAHTLGLQFGFKSGTPLSTFTGSTLSLKYQRSQRIAWRTGLSFSGAARQSDQDSHDPHYIIDIDQQTRKTRDLSLAGEIVGMIYLAPEIPIKPYVGFGPAIAFSRSRVTLTGLVYEVDPNGQVFTYNRTSDSFSHTWTFGAEAIVGAEWVAFRRLAVHAEYSESGDYQSIRARTQYGTPYFSTYALNKHSWEFGSGSIRSGLTVYF